MSGFEKVLLTLNGDTELEAVIRNQFNNPISALVHIYPDCTLMTLIMSDKLPLDCDMKTVEEGLFKNPYFDSTKDIAIFDYTDNCIYLLKDNLFKKHQDNNGFDALYPFTNSFYRVKNDLIDLYEQSNSQR